jgi:flagellar P-ring protein precursor FlgI
MKRFAFFVILAALAAAAAPALGYDARVKDIARVEGARGNQLLGYGLVVGLDGSGDTRQTVFTTQALANMLERMGATVDPQQIKVKNVAAVLVTADLPPFLKPGDRVDVTVSSLGDAKSLQGGTLVQTPLRGADSQTYAVAQGPVSIGGFSAAAAGAQVTKNHATVGRIPQGAYVEKAVPMPLVKGGVLAVSLNSPDFATASRVAEAINDSLGASVARADDAATVSVTVPPSYAERTVDLIAAVEAISVQPDAPARVVINERTGTVVIGAEVRVAPCAVSQGGLTVEITTEQVVSQPPPFAPKGAKTTVVPQSQITAKEPPAALASVTGTTIQELMRSLNAMQVTPRDVIALLQAMKQAGALQAELEIM